MVYVAPLPTNTVDEPQRQQALPLLSSANPTTIFSAQPVGQPPQVDGVATDHIVYDTSLLAMPPTKKRALLGLLAAGRSAVVIIATPAVRQPQLTSVLTLAAGTPINADKGAQLPAGTTSTSPSPANAVHANVLPGLLTAHNDNTLGFTETSIQGGGVVLTRGPGGVPTSVQWTVTQPNGNPRVVTLLGYWRTRECRSGCGGADMSAVVATVAAAALAAAAVAAVWVQVGVCDHVLLTLHCCPASFPARSGLAPSQCPT